MRYIIYILFLLPSALCSQTYSKVIDDFEGTSELGQNAEEFDGYIYCSSARICEELQSTCFVIYKFKYDGEKIWEKTIPYRISNKNEILITNDTITVSTHAYWNEEQQQREMAIIQLNLDGDIIRQVNTPLTSQNNIYWSYGQTQHKGKHYVYGVNKFVEEDTSAVMVMEFNSDLELENEYNYSPDRFCEIFQLQTAPDGELYGMVNYTRFIGDQDTMQLVKLNLETKQFEVVHEEWNDYANQTIVDFFFDNDMNLVQTFLKDNENLLNTIDIWSVPDAGVVKKTNQFTDGWQTLFGTIEFTRLIIREEFVIHELTQALNGDALLAGSFSRIPINDYDPSVLLDDTGWLARISPNGELLWGRAYVHPTEEGNNRHGAFNHVTELTDGSLVASGWLNKWDKDDPELDFWLMRVGADGCLDGFVCQELDTLLTEPHLATSIQEIFDIAEPTPLTLYPNPVSDYITIELPTLKGRLAVRDFSGKLVYSDHRPTSEKTLLDVSSFKPGLYVVEYINQRGEVFLERFVVE